MKVEVSHELEAALRRRGVILSVCSWCHEWIGEKDGLGAEGGFSGGCCRECSDRMMGDDQRVPTEAEALAPARGVAFGVAWGTAIWSVAIILAFVVLGLSYARVIE
jgi:hypothetical protein